MLSFPCVLCKSGDCGVHEHSYFDQKTSQSFNLVTRCYSPVLFSAHKVCKFVKSYAEGSSLLGVLGKDEIAFSKETKQYRMLRRKEVLRGTFGCTIKETGLFKT